MDIAYYREIYFDPVFKTLVLESKRGHLKSGLHLCVKSSPYCFQLTVMSTWRGSSYYYPHFTEATVIPRITLL